jgi:hypothetical protein
MHPSNCGQVEGLASGSNRSLGRGLNLLNGRRAATCVIHCSQGSCYKTSHHLIQPCTEKAENGNNVLVELGQVQNRTRKIAASQVSYSGHYGIQTQYTFPDSGSTRRSRPTRNSGPNPWRMRVAMSLTSALVSPNTE